MDLVHDRYVAFCCCFFQAITKPTEPLHLEAKLRTSRPKDFISWLEPTWLLPLSSKCSMRPKTRQTNMNLVYLWDCVCIKPENVCGQDRSPHVSTTWFLECSWFMTIFGEQMATFFWVRDRWGQQALLWCLQWIQDEVPVAATKRATGRGARMFNLLWF